MNSPSSSVSSSVSPSIQCPNPSCLSENGLGNLRCDRCQTLLIYRYLWAVGTEVSQLPIGSKQNDRYQVIAPQIWLDLQPDQLADIPPNWLEMNWASRLTPYLRLYPYRLHLPTIYGFCSLAGRMVLLLENVPIQAAGHLAPSLRSRWAQASAVRQIYWLWQLFQLWAPLQAAGVATSLLVEDNIRVEGWRIRLLQLCSDRVKTADGAAPKEVTLHSLATFWQTFVKQAQPQIAQSLETICQQIQAAEDLSAVKGAIATQLNQLLLEQAAQLPLRLRIAGSTSIGPQRAHNEDACYPAELLSQSDDPLLPYLGAICDGIGGHAGGEVASHLALRSLQLQVRALLTEVEEQPEIMSPEVMAQQLEAIIRVVNNMIATQNDTQGREARQRMGTTLIMALQLPQKVSTPNGLHNAHELYLAHVGDSRAYWITPEFCHLLTVDDDVATREVRAARSLYQEAVRQSGASALTQALGTRDAEAIHATVQRFIVEEEGILLLCSDGLSDNGWVERSWESICRPVFQNHSTLEAAVQDWINLANQQNGHDNTSVVMMHCHIAPETAPLVKPIASVPSGNAPSEAELSEASKALLYDDETTEPEPEPTPKPPQRLNVWMLSVGLIVLAIVLGAAGLAIWQRVSPDSFERTRDQLFELRE
jgi:protein phosphatase